MGRLGGQIAVVTGAAHGIGLAIAERFVEEGARVFLCDIDDAVLEVARRLGGAGRRADVAKRAEIEAVIGAAETEFGRIDILVNNAGITHRTSLLELTEDDYDRVMAVNVKSALFAIKAAAPGMIARRAGAIVNMSSVNAVLASADQIPYAISKGAIRQLTNACAQALAPHGIRVNAIGPGPVMTEMARKAAASSSMDGDMILGRTPLGRFAEPAEIATVAAFLASADSSYITGQTIYPDGGRLGLNYWVQR